MPISNKLCNELGQILVGTAKVEKGICIVQVERHDIMPTILGVETHSPAAIARVPLVLNQLPVVIEL